MEQSFMRQVVAMREALDFPFPVTSAYRCPDYNQRVSKTGRGGPHTKGTALDIQVSGGRAYEIVSAAFLYGMRGLGVAQTGNHATRYVHIDSRPDTTLWSY